MQRPGSRAEHLIAELITQCPAALFVITGRDKLAWADPTRSDLAPAPGQRAWPGLADGASSDPRQHLVGNLSTEDTRSLFQLNRGRFGWELSDELIDALAEVSEGLPLHVTAVLTLAARLHDEGTPLDAAALAQPLPNVVKQLMDDLTDDERNAFRAACLAPVFDRGMVKAVVNVSDHVIDQMIRWSLVETQTELQYPFRVHDEIRRLVRLDDATRGYWSSAEWKNAARRSLDEAMRRVAVAHESGTDQEALDAVVLALRIGYEWDIYCEGLAAAVARAPSMYALSSHLPPASEEPGGSGTGDLVCFLELFDLPVRESLPLLQAHTSSEPEVRDLITSWLAIRLRSTRQHEESLELFRELVAVGGHMEEYHTWQLATGLRIAGRFREALAALEDLPERVEEMRIRIDGDHGIYTVESESAFDELPISPSRRFALERAVRGEIERSYGTGFREVEVNRLLQQAVDLQDRIQTAALLKLLACEWVAHDQWYHHYLQRLKDHESTYTKSSMQRVRVLSIRALHTGDTADIRDAEVAAQDIGSMVGHSIAPKIWLEALGIEFPGPNYDWLIPYEKVRQNWLDVADRLVARSRERVRNAES